MAAAVRELSPETWGAREHILEAFRKLQAQVKALEADNARVLRQNAELRARLGAGDALGALAHLDLSLGDDLVPSGCCGSGGGTSSSSAGGSSRRAFRCTLVSYEMLGASAQDSAAELKTKYRQELLKVHPDKGGTHEGFVEVQGAIDYIAGKRDSVAETLGRPVAEPAAAAGTELGGPQSALAPPPIAALEAPAAELDSGVIRQINSAVRWNKPPADIEALLKTIGVSTAQAVAAQDPQNGNSCLHVSSQNGHIDLTKWLLQVRADVNAQNGKGQTALHMSIEYDFYFQSLLLLEHGADASMANAEGHQALKGIDGTKEGSDAWDNPVTILKAAGNKEEELNLALTKLEEADPSTIDKAQLVQAGMAKKKLCKGNWDAARFMALMKKL